MKAIIIAKYIKSLAKILHISTHSRSLLKALIRFSLLLFHAKFFSFYIGILVSSNFVCFHSLLLAFLLKYMSNNFFSHFLGAVDKNLDKIFIKGFTKNHEFLEFSHWVCIKARNESNFNFASVYFLKNCETFEVQGRKAGMNRVKNVNSYYFH